jgi:hypothetical protein
LLADKITILKKVEGSRSTAIDFFIAGSLSETLGETSSFFIFKGKFTTESLDITTKKYIS